MRVAVWTSETDGAVARIEVASPPGPKRKSPVEWLPVAIHAPTADEARSKAEAFYAGEQERFAKQEAGVVKRTEGLKAYRARQAEARA